jgi:hypothetical protein
MRGAAILERFSAAGATAQAAVPGLYAWGITVAPAAWARGSSAVSKVASIVAVLALAAGVAAGAKASVQARVAALWTFVLACALAWSAAPAAMAPVRVDALRGVAGMTGWALFALASAAPALQGRREQERVEAGAVLPPRRTVARGDAAYVAVGVALAFMVQLFGWGVATPERAMLVRITGIAAGIAIVGSATDIALARHLVRTPRSRARRLRDGMVALVLVGILGLAGLVFGVLQ